MIWLSLITLILLIVTLVGLWFFLLKAQASIRKELNEVTSRVGIHLEQTAKLSQQAGEGSVNAMNQLYQRLGHLEESSRRIYEVGTEIGKLQDILRAPKSRGGFGELMLANLLQEMIPQDHFSLQHAFRNGVRIDAVIFVGNYIVPIDAKFPRDNFERLLAAQTPEEKKKARKDFTKDVKRHIDAIAERYISPEEGTLDFALMYVPAESVYYEVIAAGDDNESQNLSAYATSRHVIPVSPNSFYAYLQVILMGLRGLRVDQAAREIVESLIKMQSDFRKLTDDFGVLGTHLNHAKGAHEKVQRAVDQFQVKLSSVDQTKSLERESEPQKLKELSEKS
jgi:DNA recombination protein RmuC